MNALESVSTGLQLRALQIYLVLADERKDWSRRLVLLAASEDSSPVALAAKAIGAAVLLIAKESADLREANQAGVTDFSVNSLSEAVRILKNEIRKGLPISVGLLDAQRIVWNEIVERGLQPDALLAGAEVSKSAVTVLMERGAKDIDWGVCTEENTLDTIQTDSAKNWRDRIAKDAALRIGFEQLAQPQREPAVRWLQAAPRLFPRDLHRCYANAWAASNEDA